MTNRSWFSIVAFIVIVAAVLVWFVERTNRSLPVDRPNQPLPADRGKVVTFDQRQPPMSRIDMDIHNTLHNTLRKLRDVNNDGKLNCVDYAVVFYEQYPDKEKVSITRNSGIRHAFNTVNGVPIEPSAYSSPKWPDGQWTMEWIWKSTEYDQSLNEDGWYRYGKYVRR